jgi:hypothetical protein
MKVFFDFRGDRNKIEKRPEFKINQSKLSMKQAAYEKKLLSSKIVP